MIAKPTALILGCLVAALAVSGCGSETPPPASNIYLSSYSNSYSALNNRTGKVIAVSVPLPNGFSHYFSKSAVSVPLPNPPSAHAVNQKYNDCLISMRMVSGFINGPYYTKIADLNSISRKDQVTKILDKRDLYLNNNSLAAKSEPSWAVGRQDRKIIKPGQVPGLVANPQRIVTTGFLNTIPNRQYDFYVFQQITPDQAGVVYLSGAVDNGPGCQGATLRQAEQALRKAVTFGLEGMKFQILSSSSVPPIWNNASVSCRGLSRCNWPIFNTLSRDQMNKIVATNLQPADGVASGKLENTEADCDRGLKTNPGASVTCSVAALRRQPQGERLVGRAQAVVVKKNNGRLDVSVAAQMRPAK